MGGFIEHPFFVKYQKTGTYNEHCRVYDMAGKTCSRCRNTIVQTTISSKKTFYCPGCQY
ncbi:zinc finger domain-containing protein [Niallia sp. 03133]|uniref:zinc finger domain-containing protein n=1 Tax=Niallia sp. 03133 TaxID=3458060 RepID=UPI0040447552